MPSEVLTGVDPGRDSRMVETEEKPTMGAAATERRGRPSLSCYNHSNVKKSCRKDVAVASAERAAHLP